MGYNIGSLSTSTFATSGTQEFTDFTNLAVGIYFCSYTIGLSTWTVGVGQTATVFATFTGGASTSTIPSIIVKGVSTSWETTVTLAGIIRITNATNRTGFSITVTGGGSVTGKNPSYNYIKIA